MPCKFYIGEVDYVTGADLFCCNNDFARFDENFFLYFEETDLQYKMYKNGLKRRIIEEPQIIHLAGQSNNAKRESIFRYISFSAQEIIVSRLYWFKKNQYHPRLFGRIYILSVLYLSHLSFIFKTGKSRRRIKDIKVL